MDPILLKTLAAVVLGFAISAILGKFLVPALRRWKAGQSIKEDGPTWHMSKQGTPTMGGLMFIAAVVVVVLVLNGPAILAGDLTSVFVLLLALVFGLIGFVDDYAKIKKKENTGLTASQKFLLQLVAAILFIVLLRQFGILSPNLYVPFFGVEWKLPWVVYMIFAALVITGTVNAVNITDGLDGLSTSVTLPVCAFFAASFGYAYVHWDQPGSAGMTVLAAALFGGLVGFLIYNFYPAKVFMGDTGSLFLGGAVCGMAFALDMPLILVLVGIIYIVETMSDIIQVLYFKATHGKRIFKMSPIHHHFEMCGWSEVKIDGVFSFITLIGVVLYFKATHGKRIFRMAPLHHHLEMGGWKETKVVFVFAGISLVFCILAFFGVMGRYPVL